MLRRTPCACALFSLSLLAGCSDSSAPTWPEGATIHAEVSETHVRLSWPAATDNRAVTGYRLTIAGRAQSLGADQTTYELDVSDSETSIQLFALDAAALESPPLSYVVQIDREPPTFPQNAKALGRHTAEGLQLRWMRASDASAIAQYEIFRGETQLGVAQDLTFLWADAPLPPLEGEADDAASTGGDEAAANNPEDETNTASPEGSEDTTSFLSLMREITIVAVDIYGNRSEPLRAVQERRGPIAFEDLPSNIQSRLRRLDIQRPRLVPPGRARSEQESR